MHQEINLATNLSVAENVMLGRERRRFGAIDGKDMRRRTAEVLEQLHLDIDPGSPLGSHSLAVQQLVSIARAVQVDAQVLVLDEPTSSLDAREVDELFEVIDRIRASGVAVMFVSHFLDQVYRISDRITVLRNGRLVGEHLTAELPRLQLVSEMIGRSLDMLDELDVTTQVQRRRGSAPLFLSATDSDAVARSGRSTSTLHNGEIVGMAGLLGSGRTETARLLFGADRADHGTIDVEGRGARLRSPRVALDRTSPSPRRTGDPRGSSATCPFAPTSCWRCSPNAGGRGRSRDDSRPRSPIATSPRSTSARPIPEAIVRNLSGGNQQKVLLARWLLTAPKLLILDEPTRGIDVGAKAEIQRLITSLADEGMSVLFISAELEEVIRLSHRIVVMRDRHKVAEIVNRGTTVNELMRIIAEDARPPADEEAVVKALLSHRLVWPILILVALLVATRLQAPNFFDIRVVSGNLFGSLDQHRPQHGTDDARRARDDTRDRDTWRRPVGRRRGRDLGSGGNNVPARHERSRTVSSTC